jgi:hypothetical protein
MRTFREHSSFRELSGNTHATFRKHSRNIQGTFREHLGNIQRTFNIQGTVRDHTATYLRAIAHAFDIVLDGRDDKILDDDWAGSDHV